MQGGTYLKPIGRQWFDVGAISRTRKRYQRLPDDEPDALPFQVMMEPTVAGGIAEADMAAENPWPFAADK
ncbi:MAG TPA: hypothetical protein VMB03_21235 [Bryobacteraceae bacterium]|nr:hypothetical protein [Bryobacteraceae bacterium]